MDRAFVDRLEIAEVVHAERAARDQGAWEEMLATYHPEASLSISWYEGSGAEFVEASKGSYNAGIRAVHMIGQPIVQVRGGRALAQATCVIHCPATINGISVIMTSNSLLHERLAKHDGAWKIVTLNAEYIWDSLAPTNPDQRLDLDADRLAGFRSSYRMLTYMQAELGYTTSPELPGVDRPDLVEALIAADQAWLTAA